MMKRALWHKSLTDEAILGAYKRQMMSLDNPGLCLICGCENEGHEPDARNHRCEACGADQVFGPEALFEEIQ